MGDAYTSQLALATSLIKRKGAACIWRQTEAAQNPEQPWDEDGVVAVDHNVDIVFFPWSSTARHMMGYANQQAVPRGTMVGYMAGQNFAPSLRDQVIVGSKCYTVVNIDTINPDADFDVLHILELRL